MSAYWSGSPSDFQALPQVRSMFSVRILQIGFHFLSSCLVMLVVVVMFGCCRGSS